MAPQRFASARYKSRPSARVPFRDDTTLVAFRYEQTVQAKPPIPIIPPPRNPARQQAAIAAAAAAAARPFSTLSSSPLVIVPPAAISPEEQHPAFRTPSSIRPIAEEVKRDSVLAPTASSVTIRGDESTADDDFAYGKLIADDITTSAGGGPPSVVSIRCLTSNTSAAPSRSETPDIPVEVARLSSPCDDEDPPRPTGSSPSPSPSPVRSTREISQRRLAKNFSFRSKPSPKRLRKKSVGSDDDDESSTRRSSRLGSPKSPKPKMSGPGSSSSSRAASPTSADPDFTPISTTIPTDSLIDDDVLTALTFSKRGSLMFGGKRLAPSPMMMDKDAEANGGAAASTPPTTTTPDNQPPPPPNDECPKPAPAPVPSIRVMPIDVERESQKFTLFRRSSKPRSRFITYAPIGQLFIAATR